MTDTEFREAVVSARARGMPECVHCGCLCDPDGAGGVCVCDLACGFCAGRTPRVTVLDDGMVRTHDEALALLRYAALGANVRVLPVFEPGSTRTNASTRRYEIRLPRLGGHLVAQCDVYKLPIPAADLARRAREVAEHALHG